MNRSQIPARKHKYKKKKKLMRFHTDTQRQHFNPYSSGPEYPQVNYNLPQSPILVTPKVFI